VKKRYDIVIADEAHYLKNPDAKRSEAFYNMIGRHDPERVILLTGTPVKNRVQEWWSLLYILKATTLEYYPFCHRFSNVQRFKIAGRNVTKFEGHKNVDDLLKLLKPVYLRRKASEVLDLPPIVRKDIFLEPEYVDAELLAAWNEGKYFATAKTNNAKIKIPHTIKYARELIDQGEGPLVIFSEHIEPVEDIAGGLHGNGYKVAMVTGKTPVKVRDDIVERFQAGEFDALVATIGSMSVGFTLTRARNMIFNDLPFVPADLLQAEKRIHRIGQNMSCVIHRIFYGKMDAHIGKILNTKLKTLIEVI